MGCSELSIKSRRHVGGTGIFIKRTESELNCGNLAIVKTRLFADTALKLVYNSMHKDVCKHTGIKRYKF